MERERGGEEERREREERGSSYFRVCRCTYLLIRQKVVMAIAAVTTTEPTTITMI